ncbi:class I SAM-dependent methyltransferase [Paraburkholderia aspalathi]|uniref:class I SAM-dependent methyltransferase n=1 Tax=Paraburkholderia aspalathi TaxID=1324617 RepID=UPI003CA0B5D5
MAKFHFVEDYEKLVSDLLSMHPIDRAMELAVGGHYQAMGQIQCNIVTHVGLKSGMTIFDLGCGSGRLAHALGKSGLLVDYIGTDIVQSLLDYAQTKAPRNYRFLLNHSLTVPLPDASVDMASAFSVFTHLLHHETYLYLEDLHRVVKPGGRVIFSFLEFFEPNHWEMFRKTVDDQRVKSSPVLNTFIERNAIEVWCGKLGFEVETFYWGLHRINDSDPLGQAVAVLKR